MGISREASGDSASNEVIVLQGSASAGRFCSVVESWLDFHLLDVRVTWVWCSLIVMEVCQVHRWELEVGEQEAGSWGYFPWCRAWECNVLPAET
jgi:hypothetical protein